MHASQPAEDYKCSGKCMTAGDSVHCFLNAAISRFNYGQRTHSLLLSLALLGFFCFRSCFQLIQYRVTVNGLDQGHLKLEDLSTHQADIVADSLPVFAILGISFEVCLSDRFDNLLLPSTIRGHPGEHEREVGDRAEYS